MRYREKLNTIEYDTWLLTQTNSDDENWNTSVEQEYLSEQSYVAMLDVVTPNWRKLQAQGVLVNNPMYSTVQTRTITPLLWRTSGYDGDGFVETDFGFVPNASAPISLDEVDVDNRLGQYEAMRSIAAGKAFAGFDLSDADLMVALGELPETVKWMTSILQRMVSIFRAFAAKKLLLKAGKFFHSGKTFVDAVSEIWLELRYAVRPLIFDFHAAVKALEHTKTKIDRFTSRGFYKTESTEAIDLSWVSLWGDQWKTKPTRVQRTSSDIRAGILGKIDSDIDSLNAVWGLNKPMELIWELTPFSFIIDWFFTTGDIISSWTPAAGLTPQISWIMETHKIDTTDTYSGLEIVNPRAWNANLLGTTQSGSVKATEVYKRRIPTLSRPILPRFNLRLDVAKITDLVTIGRNLYMNLR
jgi:hypothetical protein